MPHQHAQAHVLRRQRDRDADDADSNDNDGPVRRPSPDPADDVVVVISVDVVTQSQDAPKTLVAPAIRPRPTTTVPDDEEATTAPPPASRKPSSAHPTAAAHSRTGPSSDPSSLMVATRSPSANTATAAAGIVSSTAAVSSAAASSAADQGMSTGAKAGLALGILLVVCALLTGVLLLYRRKKNHMAAERNENEKIDLYTAPAPPPPQAMAAAPSAPSIRTNRTMSTAPRLSLRPVTQFDPTFSEQRKSAGNLLSVAAAGPAGPAGPHSQKSPPSSHSNQQSPSAWERPGAANAPTANPFNDPEAPNTVANPFGNDAALDVPQAAALDSSPNHSPNPSPMHSSHPSTDFANPAPAIAAAELGPTVMAGTMASTPTNNDLPAPFALTPVQVPASPAWTEDFPASPGPAPTGPPPVAGVIGGGPQGAPPGPDNVHRVQLDFKPSMQDELDLRAGQVVRMLHEYDDGWALCIRMDRSQQGVVPRTCLSKHPVKPRNGPPRQGPPPPGMRGPPLRPPMGPNSAPQSRPLSPASGRSSPHPPPLSSANGRMSPAPRQMRPPMMQGGPRARSNSNSPQYGSPQMGFSPQMGRPRSNSASQANNPRHGPAPGLSPMNPNAPGPMPSRKPVPGMAM
ncbi:hypothetical protein ACN47E_003766 [Coniothyrium glycines]